LGVAYGIWGASGVALTAALSAIIFGEPLTATMLAGMGLIIAGVLTIELGSQRAAERAHEQQGTPA
ncbi:MAG: SMR family transporter, partial [Micrococcaceae bacterium]|nr:SMR family transporter [Micrococcaceae bacterium]